MVNRESFAGYMGKIQGKKAGWGALELRRVASEGVGGRKQMREIHKSTKTNRLFTLQR